MNNIDRAILFVCLTVSLGGGCASLGKMPRMPWQEKEPEYKIPTKMVVTWKDAVRLNPNDPPTRGFGGRIHFYDESNKPVQVKGTLTVYGYDDSLNGEIDTEKPDRKYVFAADKLDGHYSLSKLGHSYSFWIPWDRAGGEQKEITLAPFFRGEMGQVLMSEQSKHLLPGVRRKSDGSPPEMSPSDRLAQEIAHVNYQRDAEMRAVEDAQQPQSSMRTTTIQVPATMESRLRNVVPSTRSQSSLPMKPQSYPRSADGNTSHYEPFRQTVDDPSRMSGQPDLATTRSRHVKPGLNLQNFRPDFANATQYSEYLATGQSMAVPNQAPGFPAGSPPTIPQVPSRQIDPLRDGHPPNPQSPTLWPPGLPQTPSHPGSLVR